MKWSTCTSGQPTDLAAHLQHTVKNLNGLQSWFVVSTAGTWTSSSTVLCHLAMSNKPPIFPMTLPGGQMMPHLSARMRRENMDTLWEMTGGTERAWHWINKSDENYAVFFKEYMKGQAKAISTEHSVNPDSVEKFVELLDRAENAQDITDASYSVKEEG